MCGRQVGRWQLDSKTERSLRCLLAKRTWWIKIECNCSTGWDRTRSKEGLQVASIGTSPALRHGHPTIRTKDRKCANEERPAEETVLIHRYLFGQLVGAWGAESCALCLDFQALAVWFRLHLFRFHLNPLRHSILVARIYFTTDLLIRGFSRGWMQRTVLNYSAVLVGANLCDLKSTLVR